MTTSPANPKHTPRVEDDALVRGAARFMDDPQTPQYRLRRFCTFTTRARTCRFGQSG